jgi:hypothetical protein
LVPEINQMSVLAVSVHAVERFIKRWRPQMTFSEARLALEELASHAAATRRMTLPGDARIYSTMTEEGERIHLAVRDGVVVTVLDSSSSDPHIVDPQAMFIDAISEEEARAAVERASERSRSQRAAAEKMIAEWKTGGSFSQKAIDRARTVLGLEEAELARLRFEGGRYSGLCIVVRDDDTPELILKRLREAMKGR